MTKVTFVGGENVGNVGFITWPSGPPGKQVDIVFPLNKAVEVTDKHILMKIRGMGDQSPFVVEDDEGTATHGHGENAKHGVEDAGESEGTLKGTARQRKVT